MLVLLVRVCSDNKVMMKGGGLTLQKDNYTQPARRLLN